MKTVLIFSLSLLQIILCTPCLAESVTYTYDDLNRLTKADYGNGTAISYTYDEVGNRTQKYIQATTCSNLPVKMASAFYSTLQSSYALAADGNAIQAMSIDFNENLNLNRNVSITLDGGYDCDYTTNPNYSTIRGTLTISDGAVNVLNIVIR